MLLICTYCKAQNPSDKENCIACGAPLEIPVVPSPKIAQLTPEKPIPPAFKAKLPEEIAQKIGKKAEDAYYVYAVGWRTLGESLAIAVSAFTIGVASGATVMEYWGILGGIAVGVAVGLTWKNFFFALISAPLGAFIGLLIGAIPLIFGWPKALPITTTIFAIIGARLGGRPRPDYKIRNWWEKARPYLGGLGGFIFGILGVFFGLGIEKVISLF